MAIITFMNNVEDSSLGVKQSRNLDPPGSKNELNTCGKSMKLVNPENCKNRNDSGSKNNLLVKVMENRRTRKHDAGILGIILLVLFHLKSYELLRIANYSLSGSEVDAYNKMNQPTKSASSNFRYKSLPVISRNETFGACLMVKGDNNLLSEWIPYHYTVLPLRHLLVVTDVEISEDPTLILEKWTAANTDLNWRVMNVSEIEKTHGKFDGSQLKSNIYRKHLGKESNETIELKAMQYVAHKNLVHKQNAMITYCSKFMKENGVRWISMYDTDEFLAINRIDEKEKESNGTDYGARPSLPPMDSNATVVDIIRSLERVQIPLKSCHTMPRVRFGAMESFSCPNSEDVKVFATANFDYHLFNTLRFQQHAAIEDFEKNRFGKVFVDVSNISEQTLSKQPRNIHRPFFDECIRPIVAVKQAPFYLMHYSGDWKRFQSKGDSRRGFEQWKELADISDSTSCCGQEIYRWLPRFVDQVGIDRAKLLLGRGNNSSIVIQ